MNLTQHSCFTNKTSLVFSQLQFYRKCELKSKGTPFYSLFQWVQSLQCIRMSMLFFQTILLSFGLIFCLEYYSSYKRTKMHTHIYQKTDNIHRQNTETKSNQYVHNRAGWVGRGSPCRMSIVRNGNVALSILRNGNVACQL